MGWRMLKGEWRLHMLLWGWTAFYFAWQSMQWNPTMRYQLPVYPLLALMAAVLTLGALSSLWEHAGNLALGKSGALTGLVLAGLLACQGTIRSGRADRLMLLRAAAAGLIGATLFALAEAATGGVIGRFAALHFSGTILPDNARDFHARPPEYLGEAEARPLFVEMTYVDLRGREQVKVTTGDLTDPALRNVADRRQTFVRAERYFPELARLKPGEIYVSEVIGAYVPTQIIGPYLPDTLQKAGKPFTPGESAYAGTENPVGRRFRGIVRWATPVVREGKVAGYVTLALDHDHIRQFSDRLMPTEERYTPIADAIRGNYAFLWDHRSRSGRLPPTADRSASPATAARSST